VVTVDVLQKYVNKRVREWVQRKRRGKGGIQVSMTDDTRLMPLANCDCIPPPPFHGWRARLDLPVSRSEVANLDGDCTNEIVAQAAGGLYAIDADGRQLWSAGEEVREFFIGTAYEGERIVLALLPKGFLVLDHGGKALARVLGDLQHVRLYRPSTRHMNRIVAMKGDTVLLFKSNKSVPEWDFDLPGRFESLDIRDYDNDRKLDLVLRTSAGRVVLDVDGDPLDGVDVGNLRRK
jgi:hypothetical protein